MKRAHIAAFAAACLALVPQSRADVCEIANSTVAKVTGGAAAATAVTGGALSSLGLVTVAHSSGAAIATGAGGYVAGTLGSIGATALGVVTAPATIVAATTAALAVGGTLAYCHYYAPPRESKAAPAAAPKASVAPNKAPPEKKK